MLESYGGVNVRHGTDFYQFDGGETIQPELFDMCRWILSWFGGDCCGGEFDTCVLFVVCRIKPSSSGPRPRRGRQALGTR